MSSIVQQQKKQTLKHHQEQLVKVKVASFNILASQLASNEFICEGGDIVSIVWEKRGPKILSILTEMLTTYPTCDVIVTQENDQFQWLYQQLLLQPTTAFIVGGVLGKNKKATSNIGVFYNRTKVSLLSVSVPGAARQIIATPTAVTSKEPLSSIAPQVDIQESICCEFVTRPYHSDAVTGTTGTLFSVYGAHLKSGEAYSSEIKRCVQLEALLRHICGYNQNSEETSVTISASEAAEASSPISSLLSRPSAVINPILAMDSNNSAFYEIEYPSGEESVTVNKLLRKYGFRDTLQDQPGLECFKMRHNQGGQPSKFFNLMFDRIDKIVVREDCMSEACTESYGFQRYDADEHFISKAGPTSAHAVVSVSSAVNTDDVNSGGGNGRREFIRDIRLNAHKRNELKLFCAERVDELLSQRRKQNIKCQSYQQQSDDNNVDDKGGVTGEVAPDSNISGSLTTICSHELFKGSKYESFAHLYPNRHAPSDHPPVSCVVLLQ